MGSHTDYNLGCVLTLPLGLDTWIAARPRGDRTVRLWSMNLEAEDRCRIDLVPSRSAKVGGVLVVLATVALYVWFF